MQTKQSFVRRHPFITGMLVMAAVNLAINIPAFVSMAHGNHGHFQFFGLFLFGGMALIRGGSRQNSRNGSHL